MPRQRVYKTNADRQRAYRQRNRDKGKDQSTTIVVGRRSPLRIVDETGRRVFEVSVGNQGPVLRLFHPRGCDYVVR
jgi:hypothetical protein